MQQTEQGGYFRLEGAPGRGCVGGGVRERPGLWQQMGGNSEVVSRFFHFLRKAGSEATS